MVLFSEFVKTAKNYRHHALMLVSRDFTGESLSGKQFHALVKELCDLSLYEASEASAYEIAATHSDIFIADRQRKILRLEDLAKIKELCLYSPSEAKRRLIFIENCERMNINASNALLKALEEPSAQVLFLLTTSNLSAVMPTIASRTQKIFLRIDELKRQSFINSVAADDVSFIKKQIQNFHPEAFLIADSFSEKPKKTLSSVQIKDIISRSEKLAKEYSADTLRDHIIFHTNAKLKESPEFLPVARFVLANISEWKNNERFNPSNLLWLIRIFLGFQLKNLHQ